MSHADVVTYADGDVFLGFRSPSVPNCYLVNLGPASQFVNASAPVSVNVGNIAADLASNGLFGASWYTRSDLYFSVIGGNTFAIGSEPASTIYTSDQDTDPFARGSANAQSITVTKISSLGFAYDGNASTTNSPVGLIQLQSSANSYASFQPGGTQANSGGGSFASFSPSNELNPVSETAYLTRLTPTDKPAGGKVLLGTFTISSTGVVTFTPDATPAAPSVRFTNASYSVSEAGGHATIALMRDGDTTSAFSVQVTTTDGSAASSTDYTAGPVTVNFASGASTGSASINVVDRPNFQGNRSFNVGLANVTGGVTIATPVTATVLITDDDPEPAGVLAFTNSTTSANALNGLGNPNDISIPLTRTGGAGGAVTVPVTVTGGSLASGTDFTFTTPVSFAAGVTTATLPVHLLSSKAGTITFQLGTPTGGATLGAKSSNVVTVISHGSVAFAATFLTVPEAQTDTTVMVGVTRANGATGTVTVNVAATAGTATVGTDYTYSTTTLTWADSETGTKTVSLVVKADPTVEAPKTIILSLLNPTGGLVIATPSTLQINIAPPDAVKPAVSISKPLANKTVTGTVATVTGAAKDNQGVGRVEIKLNGVLTATRTPATTPTTTFAYTADLLPEEGPNLLEVTSFDLQGNASTTVARKFNFAHLRPELAGTYAGLLAATGSTADAKAANNGYVALAVSATGVFSGKVTLSGTSLAVKGAFNNDGTARFGTLRTTTQALAKKVGKVITPIGNLSLTINLSGGKKVAGQLVDSSATPITLATLAHADLLVYSKKALVPTSINDPTKEKGYYTALFPADAAPNNGLAAVKFPQGFGYAGTSVTTAGVVKIVGKLADGSAVSFAGGLNQSNELPVFVQLYGKTGLLTGNVTFATNQSTNDASAPNMLWIKPAGLAKQVLYPDGWPNGITVDYMAAKYLVPSNKAPVAYSALGLGLTPAAAPTTFNIEVALEDGGLVAPFPTDDASINAASKVTLKLPVNPVGLTVAFTAKSGAFGGKFVHPVSGKKLSYAGIAYQKNNTAGGFFLYGPLPTAPAGTPAESGSVSVVKKP